MSIVEELKHSIDVSDKHARVAQNASFHEKYGGFDLSSRSVDPDDGVLAIFITEQKNCGSADVPCGLNTCTVIPDHEPDGVLGDSVLASLLWSIRGRLVSERQWKGNRWQRLRTNGIDKPRLIHTQNLDVMLQCCQVGFRDRRFRLLVEHSWLRHVGTDVLITSHHCMMPNDGSVMHDVRLLHYGRRMLHDGGLLKRQRVGSQQWSGIGHRMMRQILRPASSYF